MENAATAAEAAVITSYEALGNLIYRHTIDTTQGTVTIKTSLQIYNHCLNILNETNHIHSPNRPLWSNPRLSHFADLMDGLHWAGYGLKYLHQLYEYEVFKTFLQIQWKFRVPQTWHYRYLQLRHAAEAKVGLREVQLCNSKLERKLLSPVHSKLISTYCALLLDKPLPLTERANARWVADISDLTLEEWKEVCSSYPNTVISARNKLIQLRYFHQTYYTPQKDFLMRRRLSPTCHKCEREQGDFIHMVWSCNRIRPFWSAVTAFIADTF